MGDDTVAWNGTSWTLREEKREFFSFWNDAPSKTPVWVKEQLTACILFTLPRMRPYSKSA